MERELRRKKDGHPDFISTLKFGRESFWMLYLSFPALTSNFSRALGKDWETFFVLGLPENLTVMPTFTPPVNLLWKFCYFIYIHVSGGFLNLSLFQEGWKQWCDFFFSLERHYFLEFHSLGFSVFLALWWTSFTNLWFYSLSWFLLVLGCK